MVKRKTTHQTGTLSMFHGTNNPTQGSFQLRLSKECKRNWFLTSVFSPKPRTPPTRPGKTLQAKEKKGIDWIFFSRAAPTRPPAHRRRAHARAAHTHAPRTCMRMHMFAYARMRMISTPRPTSASARANSV